MTRCRRGRPGSIFYRKSLHASAGQDDSHRLRHDPKVQEDGPALNVLKVIAHSLLKTCIDPSSHLPETCDAGSYGETESMSVFILRQLIKTGGPRTNKAHSPRHHIKQLREFIKAEASKRSSEWRNARVTDKLECWTARLALLPECRALSIRATAHRSELSQSEWPPKESCAFV